MSNQWSKVAISEIATINPRYRVGADVVLPYVEMAALRTDLPSVSHVSERSSSASGARFRNGDTLFARITPCAENGKASFVDYLPSETVGIGSTEFIVLSPGPRLNPKYLYFLAKSPLVRTYALGKMEGSSGRQRVPARVFSEITVPLPPPEEQRKITAILTAMDEALASTQAVIEQVQVVKNGLMRDLLAQGTPGRHSSFKQTEIGRIPTDWQVVPFGEVVQRVRHPVQVDRRARYQEIGVRSHGRGIFHKTQCRGEELGNKKVFWVKPGCIVVNIVFAWERAVAITSDKESGMICSHRFPLFEPIARRAIAPYLWLFLTSSRGQAMLENASPGGAGRNRTLNQKEFLGIPIPLPSVAEQEAICELMRRVQTREEAMLAELESIQQLKSALAMRLLTGKLRVQPDPGLEDTHAP